MTNGTRIENYFKTEENQIYPRMPSEYGEYALSKGIFDIEEAWEEFIDYWRGCSGKNAVKRDWLATWRNCIKLYIKRGDYIGRHTNGNPRPSYSTDIDGARLAIRRFRTRH